MKLEFVHNLVVRFGMHFSVFEASPYLTLILLRHKRLLSDSFYPACWCLIDQVGCCSLYCCLVTESCLTLCNPTDCSPAGSSVHGILQERILAWVAISFSRESSGPRDQTCISFIGRPLLYHWATKEALQFIYICPLTSFWGFTKIKFLCKKKKIKSLISWQGCKQIACFQ